MTSKEVPTPPINLTDDKIKVKIERKIIISDTPITLPQTTITKLQAAVFSTNPIEGKSIMFFGAGNRILKYSLDRKDWILELIPSTSEYKFRNFSAIVSFPHRISLLITGGGPSSDVFLFSKEASSYTMSKKKGMVKSRCWHSVCYLNGEVYVIGGFDGSERIKHCEQYHVETG